MREGRHGIPSDPHMGSAFSIRRTRSSKESFSPSSAKKAGPSMAIWISGLATVVWAVTPGP